MIARGTTLAAAVLLVIVGVASYALRERSAASITAMQRATDSSIAQRDADRIRFSLDARLAGTYLEELLIARGGWNYRWRSRPGDPMRIWVQQSSLPGFERVYVALVHDAFNSWSDAGVPLLFTFTPDSTRAEIRITWVDRFEEMMTGRTQWSHDQHGWIVQGTIELALHQPDGTALGADGVAAIARHEVGHLLGLDHVRDTTHVMSPRVWVKELSEADRRTIRLVYELPPGRITP